MFEMILFVLFIINNAIGLAVGCFIFEKEQTILSGIRAILFCPIWFLFLDKLGEKENV